MIKLSLEAIEEMKRRGLTSREIDVISAFIYCRTQPDIASELFISVKTVKFHLTNIFGKLEVSGSPALRKLLYEMNAVVETPVETKSEANLQLPDGRRS